MPGSECIKNLRINPGLALLGVDGMGELTFLHNVTVLGPNLNYPSQKIMALNGLGFTTTCIKIHPDSFTHDFIADVPKWAEIKAAEYGKAVATLSVPDSDAPKCKSKWMIVLPPFIVDAMLKADSWDPVVLLPCRLESSSVL